MTTYASFKYPKAIYQLPKPCNLQGLKKKRDLRKHCGPYYKPEPHPVTGPHPGGSFYLNSDFMPGRSWQWADEIVSLGHSGWFGDDDGYTVVRGLVISLPHGRFLAGWSLGESMASGYDGTLYTDPEEAARAADEGALIVAEHEREYHDKTEEGEDEED